MAVEAITARSVREALRAIRYALPLEASPLLGMAALTLRLRAEGVADTPQSRAWLLGRYLDDVVREELSRVRAAAGVTPAEPATADPDLAAVASDFRAGNPDLEAWSSLNYRYLSPARTQVKTELAEELQVAYRTLARRFSRGYELLADALRAREIAAGPLVGSHPGAPASERLVVDAGAERRAASDLCQALIATVRHESRVLRLAPDQWAELAHRPVANWAEFYVGRIAEWCQPRYRLDERFVQLSLLVDAGEEALAGRWRVTEQRFSGLGGALAAIAEPAVVLLGPPGSGKSTILRRFELDLAIGALRGDDDRVPVFAHLGQFRPHPAGDGLADPASWLAHRWQAKYPELPPLTEVLASGRAILLLDGLNEMPHRDAADYRAQVRRWKEFLQGLLAERPSNRVVFSCRTQDYAAPLSTPALRVPQLRIEPMTDEQVRLFLALYDPGRASEIWSELAGSPQLALLRAPYFLRLLVDHVAARREVPRGRAALFTGFVRQALRREVERDNPLFQPGELLVERDYQRLFCARRWGPYELPARGVLFSKLADLAFGLQSGTVSGEPIQVRLPFEKGVELVAHPRAQEILDAGLALGLLDQDWDTDELMFSHQLLQEYFAARKLAREAVWDRVRLPWRAAEVRPTLAETIAALAPADPLPPARTSGWEETTLMAAAMAADPEALLKGLMEADLVLAGRCAAQPDVAERLSPSLIDELRGLMMERIHDRHADLRHRIACGYALGALGDPRWQVQRGPDGSCLLPPFCEIPAGRYPIGEDQPLEWAEYRTGESGTETSQMPRHVVAISPFAIARYPVTNAEWALFMASGGYEDDRWWDSTYARQWRSGQMANEAAKRNNREWRQRFMADPQLFERAVAEGYFADEATVERWRHWLALDDEEFERALAVHWQPRRRSEPACWHDERTNSPTQPVVGVCWYEARAYCAWLSAQVGERFRLPTEVEWEAAARGLSGRGYPWGETFELDCANTWEAHVRRTTPVGVFPRGDTPEGVADLAGNVYEWTASLWCTAGANGKASVCGYPYDPRDGREDPEASPELGRIARGGSWLGDGRCARSALRFSARPAHANDDIGFRLVRDIGPREL